MNDDLFTSNMTEEQYRTHILAMLAKDFDQKIEVKGIDASGSTRYVDAIITARPHTRFRHQNMAFGIEFKSPSIDNNMKLATHLMNQAMIYSFTKWEGHGNIPILMCSLNIHAPNPCIEYVNYVFRRLMGKFNIGLIEANHAGAIITMSDTVLYSSDKGVTEHGKQWKGDNQV